MLDWKNFPPVIFNSPSSRVQSQNESRVITAVCSVHAAALYWCLCVIFMVAMVSHALHTVEV